MGQHAGQLAGKTASVLGASGQGNIGQQIARRFAQAGARVLVAGRRESPLKALATELGGRYVLCDVRERDQVMALAKVAKEWTGRLDIAVNAVGLLHIKPFLEITESELERMLDVQFKGPFRFLQAMAASVERGGSIIQISSVTSVITGTDHAHYCGTKAGIDHVVRCVADEFGSRGIRVNTISPGVTRTPMTEFAFQVPGLVDRLLASYPLGRLGIPDDIASAALWLASDDCFMTGENLQVSGGHLLRVGAATR